MLPVLTAAEFRSSVVKVEVAVPLLGSSAVPNKPDGFCGRREHLKKNNCCFSDTVFVSLPRAHS